MTSSAHRTTRARSGDEGRRDGLDGRHRCNDSPTRLVTAREARSTGPIARLLSSVGEAVLGKGREARSARSGYRRDPSASAAAAPCVGPSGAYCA